MRYYLYLINNNFDDQIYIGYAKNPKNRMHRHRNPSKKEQHKHLYRAMAAHGRDNFYMNILEEHETLDSVKQAEIDVIKMFKDSGVRLYNHSEGGEGSSGYKHTEESKAKMSAAQKGIPKTEETKAAMSAVRTGKTHSEATKAKMSTVKIGKKSTEETKRKISKTKLGNKNRLGIKHTAETKAKISKTKKGNL